ncbi:MAG: mechanosensitive ion channel family protein [Planctomycetes bacterium]|nr:mechanosensitive ion channel family protein [Planctomycetota bacterium]
MRPVPAPCPSVSFRVLLATCLLLAAPAFARVPQAGSSSSASDQVASDSPRAALEGFLDKARAGDFEAAARWLELSADAPSGDGPRLARRLRFVLDHHVWFDMSQVSGESGGRADDGLTPDTEEVGAIRSRAGVDEPVRLVRVEDAAGARWLFSAATVARVDHWFGRLPDRWILEHLPRPLLQAGPFDILAWQWIALPAALLAAWFLGWFLARFTRSVLARLVARTQATWDDAVLARIGGPLTLVWLIAVLHLLLPLVGLPAPVEETARQMLRAGLFFVVFWALMRSVDVAVQVVAESQWTEQHPAARSLLPLGGRVLKMLVLALAVVSALSELGFPVASLVAGLGIGGLALALAAQKTVENLVGAFSIGMDQPMKEGDLVRIGEHMGHVEMIGLRSTRLRTLDRTLITIPNAQVSEQRVESFAARDRIRLATTIGVEYGTTRAQLARILAGFERVMRGHPHIWPETVVARFASYGESSLDIEVLCWFQTTDYNEFRVCREEVLLGFMEVVEQAGSAFAFPTRTVHVVGAGAAAPPKA